MSKIKGDNWSPFPGCPLPDFQDKLTLANARQTLFYPRKMLYARTRLNCHWLWLKKNWKLFTRWGLLIYLQPNVRLPSSWRSLNDSEFLGQRHLERFELRVIKIQIFCRRPGGQVQKWNICFFDGNKVLVMLAEQIKKNHWRRWSRAQRPVF